MRSVVIVSLLLSPMVASAAPRTFSELADLLMNIINAGIGIALILGIVIYFYGIATSIPRMSEGGAERLRAHFLWGIIALFVMFSVWGILALLRNTLFGGSSYGVGSSGSGQQVLCDSLDDCVINE